MRDQALVSRRSSFALLAITGAGPLASSWCPPRVFAQGSAPAVITPDVRRPAIASGVASGDVTSHAAIIWRRTDRPSGMVVAYATTDAFQHPKRVVGPAALAAVAIASMPTSRSRLRSTWTMARSGRISPCRKRPRWPTRWRNAARIPSITT